MPRTLVLWTLAIALVLLGPAVVWAQEGSRSRLDRFGDPLPVGALARLGTLRFHRCSCAAYAPDGKIIATTDDDEILLWEAATSRTIRRLPLENRSGVVGLIFSHDGKKLAIIGSAGAWVQVWDLRTYKTIHLAQGKGGGNSYDWSSAAAFSADDKTLYAATFSTLFVWDAASGKKLKEFPLSAPDKDILVKMIVFSEDGTVAATQGENIVHLWDTQRGKLLHEFKSSSGDCMIFSREGKMLVVAGRRHWMSLFSVATGKKIRSLPVAERVVSLAISSDGKTLAAASNEARFTTPTAQVEQVIQLWDLAKLSAPPVKLPAPGVDFVRFSPDGKTLAWGCYGQTLCFMDRVTGKDLHPTASHRGAIKSLVYLPDGKRIVSASEDRTLRLWNAETGESLRVLQGHAGPARGLALYPNGKLLASCGEEGTFRLWDLESGKSLAVLDDEHNSVVTAAFSRDGRQLASGGNRGLIFLRDPATGQVLDQVETRAITSLAFAPDGKMLATLVDHGRKLLLLDLVTKKTKEMSVPRGGSSVAYSPDGKLLAVACDETLLLLDTATNAERNRLPGHYNSRGCVVFSPDGRYLASVSDGWGQVANRPIRIFEVASGTEIHAFKKELPIFAAAFAPDGSKLIVGGADAMALVLDLKNLTGKKRRAHLTENELAACWDGLAVSDAGKAYEARVDLLHAPRSAVPFLAKRLQPAPAIDVRRVHSWIKDLDTDSFRVRDAAARELEQLGELIREPLRQALAARPSPQMRRSLRALLGKLSQLTPAQLRLVRAIEVLEGIDTPEARRILERLTQGNADGLVTTESRAALARIQKKNAPLPPSPIAQKRPAAEQPVLPAGPVLPDRYGDPMPAGAIARLGSTRWRVASEAHRILVSPDGKRLAVINGFSGMELLDAQTGRSIERARPGFFSTFFDVRMGVALSADWHKTAAVEDGGKSGPALTIRTPGRSETVKIGYTRKKEQRPIVPEEVEDSSFSSETTIEYLSALAFSPDGKRLVGSVRFEWECSGGKVNKTVKETHLLAWDAATGKEIWKTLASAKKINAILFSADGNTVMAVEEDGVVSWDAATGRQLRRWPSQGPLFSACPSPDQKWLATGSKEAVLLWEIASGKLLRRLPLPGKEIKAVAFSPDGELLAGGGERTIRFWDPLTGKAQGDCSAFPSPVQAVAFSRDGKTLFSGHNQENVLRRWDVTGRKPVGDFNGPITPVRLLAFSRDSRSILASSWGDDFHLWEAETGKPCPLPGKQERLLSECLASSGQAGLLRCEEGFGSQLALLLLGKLDRLDQLPGFLGSSVDGQRVLVQKEKDKKPFLTILKVRKGKAKEKDKDLGLGDVEREFVWKDGMEVSAVLSPDGKTVAAAGKNIVCLFDVLTGQERRYSYPTNVEPEFLFRTPSVKFSADGSRIALVGSDDKVRIVAVKDGRRLAEFAVRPRRLTGLAFSPDGQTLLTTSLGAPVHVWEVATGQLVRRLDAATYLYSPDNRLLAGHSATLKVIDLYNGRAIRVCQAEGNLFGNVAFSPNSKWLAAGCTDTSIMVWPTAPVVAPAGKPLDEKSLAKILEAGNSPDAYEAIGRMIADPERALAFLERRLHPAPRGDAKEVQVALSAEEVLHVRAIQALERIGTDRARRLLEKLAHGAETGSRTRAAAEAVERMKARSMR